MNKLLLIKSLVFSALALTATISHADSTYVEIGGNGAAYSLNYEHFIDPDYSIRVGGGAVKLFGARHYIAPVMLNKFFSYRESSHKLETGLGVVPIFTESAEYGRYIGAGGTATIGYRYLPKDSGMTFKIAYTPFFSQHSEFNSHFGVSLGYSFA